MTEEKPQRYYVRYSEEEVIIINEFSYKGFDFVNTTGGDGIQVYNKEELKKWEDTRWFKRKAQLQREIEHFEERKKKIIEQIKKEAVSSLSARLKLNSVFSLKGKDTQLGIAIAGQIEKLIEEKSIDIKD